MTKSATETLNHFDEIDAKMENLELKTAPESCLNLVNQGLNNSQTTFLDPDGNNHGAVPIPIFCQLPEAIAISGEEIEIAMDFDSADSGVFKHVIEYDENTMKQLTALTTISSKCTQGFEFHCFLAPLKDFVSNVLITISDFTSVYPFIYQLNSAYHTLVIHHVNKF